MKGFFERGKKGGRHGWHGYLAKMMEKGKKRE
jgi:hypothetical protein